MLLSITIKFNLNNNYTTADHGHNEKDNNNPISSRYLVLEILKCNHSTFYMKQLNICDWLNYDCFDI